MQKFLLTFSALFLCLSASADEGSIASPLTQSLSPADGSRTGTISQTDYNTLLGSSHAPVTLGAFGSSPSATGFSLSGQALSGQPADATHPGAISLSDQTLGAGLKTFTSVVAAPGINAGTNTVLAATNGFLEVTSPAHPNSIGPTSFTYNGIDMRGTFVPSDIISITNPGGTANYTLSTVVFSGGNTVVSTTTSIGGFFYGGSAQTVKTIGSVTNTVASAFGSSNTSNGQNGFSVGSGSFASGLNSFAVGQNAIAGGFNYVRSGSPNNVSTLDSTHIQILGDLSATYPVNALIVSSPAGTFIITTATKITVSSYDGTYTNLTLDSALVAGASQIDRVTGISDPSNTFAMGRNAKAQHNNAFVFSAAGNSTLAATTQDNQFLVSLDGIGAEKTLNVTPHNVAMVDASVSVNSSHHLLVGTTTDSGKNMTVNGSVQAGSYYGDASTLSNIPNIFNQSLNTTSDVSFNSVQSQISTWALNADGSMSAASGAFGVDSTAHATINTTTTTPAHSLFVQVNDPAPSGMVEFNNLDTTGFTQLQITNGSGGSGGGFYAQMIGPGFAGSGLVVPGASYMNTDSNATGGMVFNTESASPVVFGSNSVEALRLSSPTGLASFWGGGVTVSTGGDMTMTGILKLPVQPAASTPTCASGADDGKIALTNAHALCVCNGSGWFDAATGLAACSF